MTLTVARVSSLEDLDAMRDLVRAPCSGTMEDKRMLVRSEARGHGGALLAEARAAGHSRAILSTHKELHAAQALHVRHKILTVPPPDEFLGVQPDIEVCMARALNQPGAAA